MHPVPVNGECAQILVKLFENLSVIAGAMPPPLAGEALAVDGSFLYLPKAPLSGKTPPAGGGGTKVPKGEWLAREA